MLLDDLNNYEVAIIVMINEKNIVVLNELLNYCDNFISTKILQEILSDYEFDDFVFLLENFFDNINFCKLCKLLISKFYIGKYEKYLTHIINNYHDAVEYNIDEIYKCACKHNQISMKILMDNFFIDYTQYYDYIGFNLDIIKYIMDISNYDYANYVKPEIITKLLENVYHYCKKTIFEYVEYVEIFLKTNPDLLNRLDITNTLQSCCNRIITYELFEKYSHDIDSKINYKDLLLSCCFNCKDFEYFIAFNPDMEKYHNDFFVEACRKNNNKMINYLLKNYPEINLCHDNSKAIIRILENSSSDFILDFIDNHIERLDIEIIKNHIEKNMINEFKMIFRSKYSQLYE